MTRKGNTRGLLLKTLMNCLKATKEPKPKPNEQNTSNKLCRAVYQLRN